MSASILHTAKTVKMHIEAKRAADMLNASGILDNPVYPTVSQTTFGTSVYLQFRVNGEFYKIRYSDHNCQRSGEIEVYTPAALFSHVDRFINPAKWEQKKVACGRRVCEVNAEQMAELPNAVVMSERVTSKGTTRYNVECDKLQLTWVRK